VFTLQFLSNDFKFGRILIGVRGFGNNDKRDLSLKATKVCDAQRNGGTCHSPQSQTRI